MTNKVNEIDLPVILEKELKLDDGLEEKRETLIVLATLMQCKMYFGKELSCTQIYDMKKEKIEKYFSIYQKIRSIRTTQIIIRQRINLVVYGLSYLLPLENKKLLVEELKEDELLKNDLEYLTGYLILKGGRFVGLASAFCTDKIMMKVPESIIFFRNEDVDVVVDRSVEDVDKCVEKC